MPNQSIQILDNLPSALPNLLASLSSDRLFILTDTNTRNACYPLIKDIPPINEATLISVPPGDANKSLEQASNIWQTLSNNHASRRSILINLGGGMISDLGGFAAATFKRGLRTVNIPTTLMASVDAAIGGKTAINFNGLKNEIGAFLFPEQVWIDCTFLRTLDPTNLRSGYAEMIKHALIDSQQAVNNILAFDLDNPDLTQLHTMVAHSIAVKQRIVDQDPTEQNARKALNLGHTIGHALESLSLQRNHPIPHGYAIAAGIVAELYLACKLCNFPSNKLSQIAHYIKTYYPPLPITCQSYDNLYQQMTHDKKNVGSNTNFTLLADTGRIQLDQSPTKTAILEALDFYRDYFGI